MIHYRIMKLMALAVIAVNTAIGQQAGVNVYLTPPSLSVSATGGTAAVAVTVSPAAQWSVSIPPASPWLAVTSGAAGSANGLIEFQVSPNPSGISRCANVPVGGATLVACQEANASLTMVTLDGAARTFGEMGGAANVAILSSTAPAGTTPASTAQWVTASLSPGAAEIELQVQQNTVAASRVAQVTYGDATIQISQAPYRTGLQNLIVGVIRDRSTGNPIAGAGVFFYGGGYGFATADTNGVYAFTGNDIRSFGGALTGMLYLGAPGYFEAPPITIPDLGSQPSFPLVEDVTLKPGGTMMRGVVKDAAAGPSKRRPREVR